MENQKPKYESPRLIPLGEISTGAGPSDNQCNLGSSASNQCANGNGAFALCNTGGVAGATCKEGNGPRASCNTGSMAGGACVSVGNVALQ